MTSSVRLSEPKTAWRVARALTGVLAAGLAACAIAYGQDSAAPAQSGMAALGRLVPLGYVSRKVRIPSFSDDGTLASVLSTDTLVRINDDHLQAGKCAIQIFGKTKAEDVQVDLRSAVYHLVERTLRSGERSTVTRSDFKIEGDAMVFQADTAIGQMKGRVRTIIFDTGALSRTSKDTAKPTN